ncbi:putative pantetheine-phosphate adenylyltransferase [Aspergillus saccharolyticus JOP 1030-1]|uniref:Pantetheine-phosphate adenylyltransferase family protein n=1 Tax=Aspergillus saccharolyticus JOP 1030-1 TaxID=1450539 RepID=A0A318ZIJ7_9EURO|nr:pantetheine-phosphate adenylyltransferase family protein [Aspergillus saccharolyticus JOP 1030-1]PYH47339.1 pantetheine-phosphate adenylyltransferase family protein [Aspergillus saccharolyticus JOP 1030-1]
MASVSTSALLLLPPPPAAEFDQLKYAYEIILSTVCSTLHLKLEGTDRVATLDVALSLPGLLAPSSRPRTRAFASLQSILEGIYRLIGIVCIEHRIELDMPGGIDARVILLDCDVARSTEKNPAVPRDGPIVDLRTLAESGRPWNSVYYPDNQIGLNLAASFSSFYPPVAELKSPGSGLLHAIPDAPHWTPSESVMTLTALNEATAPYTVAVGGTFDHFHIGHKLLLTATALVLQPAEDADAGKERVLIVGVTGDELLVKKKYPEFLESWEERCHSTGAFLTAIMDFRAPGTSKPQLEKALEPGPTGKSILMKIRPDLVFRLVEIKDPFGPTITEEDIGALVVSKETRSGGAAVNDARTRKGWAPLAVFEVDVLHTTEVPPDDAEDFASKISSTDIRRRRMEKALQ